MERDVDIDVYFWYVICAAMKCREASENEESQSAGVSYCGGDGSTPEKAVAIGGIQSRTESVQAEKKYLAQRLGEEDADWCLQSRSLLVSDRRIIDKLTIEKASGEPEEVYFEISELFRPSR